MNLEINLLPKELRPRKKIQLPPIALKIFGISNVRPIVLVAWLIAILFTLQMLFSALQVVQRSRLGALQNRFSKLSREKGEVDAIKKQIASITQKVASVGEGIQRPFSLAEKLNAISDAVVSGMWLTQLAYDEKTAEVEVAPSTAGGAGMKRAPGAKAAPAKPTIKRVTTRTLSLSGYVYSAGEDSTAYLNRFIDNLKKNEGFYFDFNNIAVVENRVEFLQLEKGEGQEVTAFSIVCQFRQ